MTTSAGLSRTDEKLKAPFANSVIKVTVAALLASSSASAVQAANCGAAALGGGSAGPPSISATEASTTQVLEEIRRRTQVAQQQMQPTPVSDTTTAPAATGGGGSAASGGGAKPTGQAAAGSYKPKYTKVATASPTDVSDYSYDGGTHKVTSSWGQAYLDYEFHDNIAPGTQENRARNSKTAGALSGTDWTWISSGAVPQAFQFGVFSGYQGQFNKFGDTTFSAPQTTDNTGVDTFTRTGSNQDIQGSFYGAYIAAIHGNATFDLAFKADDFDLHQSSLLTQTNGTCGPGNIPNAIERGGASVNNYTISGDASYRHHLSSSNWLEPTIGLRYTWTDYGNDATQLFSTGGSNSTILQQLAGSGRLGLVDGTVFRVTAGLRAGHEEVLANGALWTIWGGAYAYSDVAISGFQFTPPSIAPTGLNTPGVAGTTVFPVDEGKVRGLGQIVSTWDYNDHWSYLMAGEIRGGSDLFGIGGRIGARYRW